jgi:hypothetical protein
VRILPRHRRAACKHTLYDDVSLAALPYFAGINPTRSLAVQNKNVVVYCQAIRWQGHVNQFLIRSQEKRLNRNISRKERNAQVIQEWNVVKTVPTPFA